MSKGEYSRLREDPDDDGDLHQEDLEGPTSLFCIISTIFVFFTLVCCTVILATLNQPPSDLHTIPPSADLFQVTNQLIKKFKKYSDHYFTQDESQFLNCSEMIKGDKDTIARYVNGGRMKLDKERVFELPMDCESIKERVYGDMPPFKPLKRPIALVRTIFKMYELQEALFSMSYHPDNVFCYTMDSKSTDKLKNSMRVMSKCFPNVIVMEKEYNLTSGGHGQDPAHFDCLEKILDRKWDHAVILQNNDLIIKTPYQLSDISSLLNYTSFMGLEYGYWYRYNTTADWTPAGLNLFKNETGVPPEILHRKLRVRKSLNEVIMSKVFVKSMLEKLNLKKIITLFDKNKFYGVDEMLVPTLYTNYLGLEGQMESNCTKFQMETFTRWTNWNFVGPDGFNDWCKSKWKRHGICVLGVEYLNQLSKSPSLTVNKVMSTFDFGTIICTREMIKKNGTGQIPSMKWFREFPQFREMQSKANGTYDKKTFKC